MKSYLIAGMVGISLAVLSGCNKDKDRERSEKPENAKAEKKTHAKYEKQAEHGADKGEKAKAPKLAEKYSGRWESGNHKGHGGGLSCVVTESGAHEWDAVFTAEFGKTKDYTVKLKGKPDGEKVVFGGKVDLGKEDGGVFTWSGVATEKSFDGKYEGGGDVGAFTMTRK